MADGTRYTQTFVADPSCCPSRSSLMTGRYPHNNGVRNQQDGPKFDSAHSMACYFQQRRLRDLHRRQVPDHLAEDQGAAVLRPLDRHVGWLHDVAVKVDGTARKRCRLQHHLPRQPGPRLHHPGAQRGHQAVPALRDPAGAALGRRRPNGGTTTQLAVPDTKYANAAVGTCSGVPEADRADKPAYVRTMNFTTAQAQAMCQSQMRAIMTADDEFDATMKLLQSRGVLDNTLVIFSSDNGYMWGEHGRWEKFVPYEPSIRVPLWVRWPGHFTAGVNTTRIVVVPRPPADDAGGGRHHAARPGRRRSTASRCCRPATRTTMYSEYYNDPANKNIPSWRMVRQGNIKYVQTYNATGAIIAREYYNLTNDPAENTNLLGDTSTANDPTAGPDQRARRQAERLHHLHGRRLHQLTAELARAARAGSAECRRRARTLGSMRPAQRPAPSGRAVQGGLRLPAVR